MIGNKKIYIIHDGTLLSNNSNPSNARIIRDHLNNQDGEDTVIYKEGPGVASGMTILGRIGATSEAIWGTETKDRLLDTMIAISDNYTPGAELHFMGFSRGAFEVRSLVAIIRRYGIVKKSTERIQHLKDVLNEYYRVNRVFQSALYIAKPDETTAAAYRPQFTAKHRSDNFHAIPYVNSLCIFDTVPGLPDKALWEHDIHESPGFVLRWVHLMASEVTHLFQNYSYLLHDDRNRFRCGHISETKRIERQYYGDHCNIGGSWMRNPAETACISNNVLHDMIKYASSAGWNLTEDIHKCYPSIDEDAWRRGTGVFGIYPSHQKPKHDDELGRVMPLMYISSTLWNAPMVIDREHAEPQDLHPKFFPPQPNYYDGYKNFGSSIAQSIYFLLSHYGGHAYHLTFLAKQSEALSLLIRGASGTAMCAPSSIFGIYLFLLTDLFLVACGIKSPYQLLVNASAMCGAAGIVLWIGPFAYSGWALLLAVQGAYYTANTLVNPEDIHKKLWYKG